MLFGGVLAVKVAYDGTRFSGSQVQPGGVRTVHGELAAALAQLGAPDARIRWAGRTDAGVSARGNVAVFDAPLAPEVLLPALTFRMRDAWAWAWAEVPTGFEPRRASRRWYRYHLRSGLDEKALEEALAPFVGEHDFTAFARLDGDATPIRRVHEVSVERQGPHLVVDVRGESFLWNQVRRMVEAGRRAAEGEIAPGEIERALREGKPRDLGCAPPEPLVLMDVAYEGVAFRAGDARLLGRLHEGERDLEDRLAVMRALGSAPEAPR